MHGKRLEYREQIRLLLGYAITLGLKCWQTTPHLWRRHLLLSIAVAFRIWLATIMLYCSFTVYAEPAEQAYMYIFIAEILSH